MLTKFKLDTAFELKAKYGFTKGTVVKCNHTVNVQTKIEKLPLREGQTETETAFTTIEGGTTVMYVGPTFDHWSGKLFLEFISDDRVVYYNYWDQHQAGDELFATTFKKVSDSSVHHGIM